MRGFKVGFLAGLAFFAGCAAAKQGEADALYTSQQLACVDQNQTKADIDACRQAVRAKWGRGADGLVVVERDGGTQ